MNNLFRYRLKKRNLRDILFANKYYVRRWQFDHHILGYLYVFVISIHFLSGIYLKASVQEIQEAIGLKLWVAAFYFIFLALYFLVMNRFITARKYIILKKSWQNLRG